MQNGTMLLARGLMFGRRHLISLYIYNYTRAERAVRDPAAPLTLRIPRNRDGGDATLRGDSLAKEEGWPTIPRALRLVGWRAPFLGNFV